VKQVTEAGQAAEFAAGTVRTARRRCNQPVDSTATTQGWMWTIREDTETRLAA